MSDHSGNPHQRDTLTPCPTAPEVAALAREAAMRDALVACRSGLIEWRDRLGAACDTDAIAMATAALGEP